MRRIALLLRGINEEGPHRRHFARGRRRPQAIRPPVGEERAQVRRVEVQEAEPADFLAAMAAKKFDQAVGSGDIGPHGVWAAATIMSEIVGPACRERTRRMPFPV